MVIQHVKQILTKQFAAAARLKVSQLIGEGKFMITEDRDLVEGNTKVASMLQVDSTEALKKVLSSDNMEDGTCPQSDESTNVITVHQASCSCKKWQDHKYLCQHKWKKSFIHTCTPTKYVHPY